MSRSSLSMFVFGLYLVAVGIFVIVAPNVLLGWVGLPPARDVWIRVAGVLAAAIGYYYLRAVRDEARSFYRGTVHARLPVPVCFGVFVALVWAKPMLLLFAAVDLAAATWTALALRLDEAA